MFLMFLKPAGYLGLLPHRDHIAPIFCHFEHGTARRNARQEDQQDRNYFHFGKVFLFSGWEEECEEMRRVSTTQSPPQLNTHSPYRSI